MSEEEYAISGPLTTIFQNPIARILDQSLIVGNMEQTIPMLIESTNLSYKTAQSAVVKLEKMGFIKATRKIGNAQAYSFTVKGELRDLLNCVQKLQTNRLNEKRRDKND